MADSPVGFLRKRLTFSNVIALLALFIALGGTSYAVTALPKNSVGTQQLKKNAVTGVKVKNGSLSSADLCEDWTDAQLCEAVANKLGVDVEDVAVAEKPVAAV